MDHTYTCSIYTLLPTTGMNEKILSNKQLIGHIISTGFVNWRLAEERNGHSPMPKSGTLNIHLYVNDRPWNK